MIHKRLSGTFILISFARYYCTWYFMWRAVTHGCTKFSNSGTSPGRFKEFCKLVSRASLYFLQGNLVLMWFCSRTGCGTLGFCCVAVQRYTPSWTGQTEILSEAAAVSTHARMHTHTHTHTHTH